jgi:hypothetical protein
MFARVPVCILKHARAYEHANYRMHASTRARGKGRVKSSSRTAATVLHLLLLFLS